MRKEEIRGDRFSENTDYEKVTARSFCTFKCAITALIDNILEEYYMIPLANIFFSLDRTSLKFNYSFKFHNLRSKKRYLGRMNHRFGWVEKR